VQAKEGRERWEERLNEALKGSKVEGSEGKQKVKGRRKK
jgi:hypothetical protein